MPVFLLLEQTSSRWIFIVSNNGTFLIHPSIIVSLGWFQSSVTIDMTVCLLDIHPNVGLQVSVLLCFLEKTHYCLGFTDLNSHQTISRGFSSHPLPLVPS